MAEQPLFPSFQEFIHTNHLFERGEKILVSVSGGVDSMVMLHLLCSIQDRMQIKLFVAHFNHRLRGMESDGDEQFVREAATEQSLECYVETADTRQMAETEKRSIQEVARNMRYEFLTKIRRAHGFQKIATAHNADDNAETILFNIFRGTGIHGMTGIPVERQDQLIIRPLLFATRSRILEYAQEHSIPYREDSSNATNKYTRNFIRHDVVPVIRENINPNLVITLNKSGRIFAQLESYLTTITTDILKTMVEERSPEVIVLNNTEFNAQPEFLQENILHSIGVNFCRSEIDFNTVKTMARIAGGETGSSCSITKEIVFYKNRDHLIFQRVSQQEPFWYTIELEKAYTHENFTFESAFTNRAVFTNDPQTEFIDADKLGTQLVVRSWEEGDWFVPFGTNDKKKISDYFIDMKIPLFEKHSIPLLISDGMIVWVVGMRLDNRFKVTLQTKRILKLHTAQRNP
jgi:tRNA(Ile)-lysidine synthase